ncbi:MAG: DoxX family protein [Candidatus Azobacteroides sp.]|nr:DoxX family protein [Candidatus Azobacteroides sp.]
MKQKIIYIVCVIIGIVFIISGGGKVINTVAFRELIVQYGLGRLQLLSPGVAILEIAVGIALILRIKPKLMLFTSAAMLLVFTAVFTYGHFKTGITDCGCFGELKVMPENIAFVYARNTLLLILSLFAGFYCVYRERSTGAKVLILLVLLLPVFFLTGLTFRYPISHFRKNKPDTLLNKNVSETPLRQYIQTAPDSTYFVFFYSYTCPHCINSIENFKDFQRSGVADSVASFVMVGSDTVETNRHRELFTADFGYFGSQEIMYDSIKSFIKGVPTALYIKNDTIKEVLKSELPSPVVFRYSLMRRR